MTRFPDLHDALTGLRRAEGNVVPLDSARADEAARLAQVLEQARADRDPPRQWWAGWVLIGAIALSLFLTGAAAILAIEWVMG